MENEEVKIDYQWDLTNESDSGEDFHLELQYDNQEEAEDVFWQARTGLNYQTLCGAVEAIVFMSDRPLNLQKIKNQIDNELPLRVVHEAIQKLQAKYEDQEHGIRLMEVAEGFQFRTKVTYSRFIQKMFKATSLVLSPTALEVLSIIAYKQPVSKTDVESIRGVDSSHIIRTLMDKRLVKIVGRSEELGKASLFGTTPEFLEVFNLPSIDLLPSQHELEELAASESVGDISDIKDVVSREDRNRFEHDELQELDELSKNIKSISADTDFTRSLSGEEKKKIEAKRTGQQEASQEAPKSAFDILEEFIARSEAAKQNEVAADSDIYEAEEILHPESIKDLKAEIAEEENSEKEADPDYVPFFSEEDEEDEEDEWEEDGAYDEPLNAAPEEIVEEEQDSEEEKELESALDKAFSDLTSWEEEATEEAKSLDLDLNFLQSDLDSK